MAITKTVILGGGLSGIALGNLIKDNFIVLEKNSDCGGLCRSLSKNGFTFDYGGSHIIFSRDKDVLNFMVNALGTNVVKNRRNTKIYFKGKYIKYPFENGLSGLEPQDNFECLHGFIQTLTDKKKKEPKNFKEWIYRTFGKGIAEKYMVPYNEKIWNYKTEKMNTEWISGRVPKPPVKDIIKSSVGVETEGYTHQLHFYYPKIGGIQSMIRSLEDPIKDKIVLDFKVKSIKKHSKEFVVSDGNTEYRTSRLISTLPLPEIIKTLDSVPKNVKEAVKNLKYNSLITVMIGLDTEKINNISWLYIPSETDGIFNRVSFPSNYSPNVAPKGKSAVLVEITCNFNDTVWKTEDKKLINDALSNLHKMNIIDKKKVCFSKVKRSKYAYIIYDLNHAKNVKIVKDYLQNQGIEIVGRFSEFEYLNMDACIRHVMDFVGGKK